LITRQYLTSIARSEDLMANAPYQQPWSRGQRCVILAWAFFEPNWDSDKHVPWNFRRADGLPWVLNALSTQWSGQVCLRVSG
jgi:putative SOS response-associated peptidase YedK